MRIIFLTGSIEPGKDGVGDYIARLAEHLTILGHRIGCVGLYDKHVEETAETIVDVKNLEIEILRLPFCMPAKLKLQIARVWIEKFNPEWLSLQFVPYAFHKKGLPISIHRFLSSLSVNRKWHIMFHEIWLNNPVGYKQYVTSWVQKLIVFRCVVKLKPDSVNVSIDFNKKRLKKIGVNSSILSLFGNIPMPGAAAFENLELIKPFQNRILYFGTAPRGKFLQLVVEGILDASVKISPLCIILVGEYSDNKKKFIDSLSKNLSGDSRILDFGFLEADSIAILLQESSVGIVRSHPDLLGKSGTAVAMLEFGLPVWLPTAKKDEQINFPFRKNLIYASLTNALQSKVHMGYEPQLPNVASLFLSQLQKH
jgi:hypothetical protein